MATNRVRHLRALVMWISSLSAIAVLLSPSAAASTIRDRIANALALVDRRDHANNWERSSSVRSTIGATGFGTYQF
ncbi:MAG: hypothetical protein ACLQI9_01920 [Mycobacterium sp.]